MNKYAELLIVIGSLGTMMWGMLKFMLRDIHSDLLNIKTELKRSEERIDHLYQICVDILKTRR
jgi:hypothetical protein